MEHHSPDCHKKTCYCGRKATRHVSYGTGCANTCGIHARVISNRKGGFVTITNRLRFCLPSEMKVNP
jgi:hypothetical protein